MAKSVRLPEKVVFEPQHRQPLKFSYEKAPLLQAKMSTQPSPKMSIPPTYSSSRVRETVKFSFTHDNPQIRTKANSLPIINK